MKRSHAIAVGLVAVALLSSLVSCTFKETPTVTSPESTSPAQNPPSTSPVPFTTSGYVPQPVEHLPYLNELPLLDLNDPKRRVDASGAAIYTTKMTKEVLPHPVVLAQHGLAALNAFDATKEAAYLTRAIANASRLLEISVDRDGALWFPYTFDWTYQDEKLIAPWWSGMAQGQALSLFVRLNELTDDARWLTAAESTFLSFGQDRSSTEPWTKLIDDDGYLWFEEYAGNTEPLLVLNGHIFAIYGIYDYYMLTGDKDAVALFDGAATTVRDNLHRFRVEGGASYYCARVDYCQIPRWQDHKYHGIVMGQLSMLAKMTGDPVFQVWSDLLKADFDPTG